MRSKQKIWGFFQHLMDQLPKARHWELKKKLAKGITNADFDRIYKLAKKNGALGGKISGAGGGGFFTFYCEDNQDNLRSAMASEGLRELKFDFDFEGTKILANFMSYNPSELL